MTIRIVSAALAAAVLTTALASDALADRRRHRVYPYDRYYAGPQVVEMPGFMRLMFGGYRMSPEDYDEIYGSDNFDESYYDPQLDLPVKKLKPPKPAKTATAKPVTPTAKPKKVLTTASVSTPPPETSESASAARAATTESIAAPAGKSVSGAGGILSCDKAGAIVGSYGFSSVKSSDCAGEVYAFNATRDGKTFAIKLNAVSGELTEVKKLQ